MEAAKQPTRRRGPRLAPLALSSEERSTLQRWAKRPSSAQALALRCRIVLAWRTETWKLSSDPQFIDKVRDIVGLYLNPPEHAVVLCVDEKTSVQAVDRTQPVLPLRPGLPERRTHDYIRHGTTSLFAALDAATGQVVHQTHRRHRATEFRKFLAAIDHAVP